MKFEVEKDSLTGEIVIDNCYGVLAGVPEEPSRRTTGAYVPVHSQRIEGRSYNRPSIHVVPNDSKVPSKGKAERSCNKKRGRKCGS